MSVAEIPRVVLQAFHSAHKVIRELTTESDSENVFGRNQALYNNNMYLNRALTNFDDTFRYDLAGDTRPLVLMMVWSGPHTGAVFLCP